MTPKNRLLASLSLLLLLAVSACSGGNSTTTPNTTPVPPAPAGSPTISSFTPSATATNAGRNVTLNWVTTGATKLTLQPGAVDVTGLTTTTVTLPSTTAYTLEATNSAGTSRSSVTVRAYDWTATGNVLDGFVGASGTTSVTGYSFVVFDKAGTLYERSGGDQSDSTIAAIASSCKAPAVAAILSLVDAGKLDLDTPIKNYLAADPLFILPPDKDTITMRMLLAHTSGIVGLAGNQPPCQGNQSGTTLRACAQQIANSTLTATPGTTFNYGGSDYQLAGFIATVISGQTWQDFFNASIATPIGMHNFSFGTFPNPTIAGGAISDVGDLALFVRMIQNSGLVNGVRVLSPAMIAEIKKDQIAGLPVTFAPFPASRDGFYPGYGFGEFISKDSLHPGSAGPEFSDPGLFGAVPWFDDDLGYGAVLLISKTTDIGLNIWDAVRPTIIQQYNGQ